MSMTISKAFTASGQTYNAEITFDTMKQASEAGAKYVIWALQRHGREGKLTVGKVVKADHEGNVYKSTQDILEEMDLDQVVAAVEALKAKAAKKEDGRTATDETSGITVTQHADGTATAKRSKKE